MELPFVLAILMAFAHCTDAQRYFPPPRGDSDYGRPIDPGYPVPHAYPPPPPRYPAPPASVYGEGFRPNPRLPPPPPGHYGSEFAPPNYQRPAYPYSDDNERRWSWTSFLEWLPMPDMIGMRDERGRPRDYPPPPPPPPPPIITGLDPPFDPGFSPYPRPGGFNGHVFPQYPKYPFPRYPSQEKPENVPPSFPRNPPQETPENVSPPPPQSPGDNPAPPPQSPGDNPAPPPQSPGNNTTLPPGNPGNEAPPSQIQPTLQP